LLNQGHVPWAWCGLSILAPWVISRFPLSNY
jgi:hypothetical protein